MKCECGGKEGRGNKGREKGDTCKKKQSAPLGGPDSLEAVDDACPWDKMCVGDV